MEMFRKVLRVSVPVTAGFLVAGCTGTIFNTLDLSKGESMLIDARQRVITNSDFVGFDNGQVTPRRIVCAEPSPDVATAVANSFGAGVSVFGYGSGTVNQAFSEAIAQLGERVATVQLLRDVLYRACEAYANGAISNTTYAMITARLGQTMATLLLGEMAAGAFGRNLAGAGGAADSKAVAELVEAVKLKQTKDTQSATQPGTSLGGGPPKTPSVESDAHAVTTVLAGLGALSGRAHTPEIAAHVARIHRAFINADNLDGLLVACVTSLGREPASDPAKESALSRLCKNQILNDFEHKVTTFLAAKADAEVKVIRATAERAYVEALARCFEAQVKTQAKDVCERLVEGLSRASPR